MFQDFRAYFFNELVTIEDCKCLSKCRWIRCSWSGGDDIEWVAHDIRDYQGNQEFSPKCFGKPATFHPREMLADAVHLIDCGTRTMQKPRDGKFIRQRNAECWCREQRGATAG